MGYKSDDPCLQKALPEERLFVLMTRDQTAPQTVIEWIKLNIGNQPSSKLHEALDCALEMHFRNEEMKFKKSFPSLEWKGRQWPNNPDFKG